MRKALVILASLFLIFPLAGIAQTTTTTTVVEKKEILSVPPKSASCTTVKAHWEGNVWFDTQTVCTYQGRSEGVAWVQDYWACTAASAGGDCTAWEYRPGHWVQTLP